MQTIQQFIHLSQLRDLPTHTQPTKIKIKKCIQIFCCWETKWSNKKIYKKIKNKPKSWCMASLENCRFCIWRGNPQTNNVRSNSQHDRKCTIVTTECLTIKLQSSHVRSYSFLMQTLWIEWWNFAQFKKNIYNSASAVVVGLFAFWYLWWLLRSNANEANARPCTAAPCPEDSYMNERISIFTIKTYCTLAHFYYYFLLFLLFVGAHFVLLFVEKIINNQTQTLQRIKNGHTTYT